MTTSNPVWRQAVISGTSTIEEVIRNLDRVAIKIVLVVNESGHLEGTVSDGDIRRGLLSGLDLASPIDTVIHRNPLVVSQEIGRHMVVRLMMANKVQQVPIVNEQGQLIGLHLWDRLAERTQRPNTMVIMAGGLGQRLRPHTERCPKPLLTVGGKPILEHIINRAKAEGFESFILAINYLGHMIEDYFGDGDKWGIDINYLRETEPLGTAGALSLLETLPEQPILVSNGDVLTDVHYGELMEFHFRHRADATMAIRIHEWQHPFGVVHTDGVDIVGFEEKPVARNHINAGVYVLSPSVLQMLDEGKPMDMPNLFTLLRESGKTTIAFPVHEPWLDVGRATDLQKAHTMEQNADD